MKITIELVSNGWIITEVEPNQTTLVEDVTCDPGMEAINHEKLMQAICELLCCNDSKHDKYRLVMKAFTTEKYNQILGLEMDEEEGSEG